MKNYVMCKSSKQEFGQDLIRYGTILSDREFTDKNCIRVREIIMDGKRYLHHMVNGEVKNIINLEEVETYLQKKQEGKRMEGCSFFPKDFMFLELIIQSFGKILYDDKVEKKCVL